MQPPRARARSTALAASTLALVLAGCGSTTEVTEKEGPSKAALACRGHWKDLGNQIEGRNEETHPSALPERWTTVVATVDYYASSAGGKDCQAAIETQKKAISALEDFSDKLAPYDMELRVDQLRNDAQDYASGPRPPAPSPTATKGKKGKKKSKKPPRPPKPADVAAALKTATTQASLATEQQGPAWRQARVVELSDAAAVRKAVKDLRFLSSQSAAYTRCTKALSTIRTALAATG